jgi:hypothetical protein
MWRDIHVKFDDIHSLMTLAGGIGQTNLVQRQREHRTHFLAEYDASEVKKVYEEKSDFICWFMQQMMNRRKVFISKSSELSLYLFEKLHWVYALGYGETHVVEFIAIVFLSFYVYTTSMFDELMQLLYQFRAHTLFSSGQDVRRLIGLDPYLPEPGAASQDVFPAEIDETKEAGMFLALRYTKVCLPAL